MACAIKTLLLKYHKLSDNKNKNKNKNDVATNPKECTNYFFVLVWIIKTLGKLLAPSGNAMILYI